MASTMMKSVLRAAAFACAAAAVPAMAGAQDAVVTNPNAEVLRAQVSMAGMNLGDARTVARLQRQIRGAIAQVCPLENHLNLTELRHSTDCRSSAQRQASAQLDAAIARTSGGQLASAGSAITISAR